MSPDHGVKLEWLTTLRRAALEVIEKAEAGEHFVGMEGEEHLRDAIQAYLDPQRAFAAKLARRIAFETGREHG